MVYRVLTLVVSIIFVGCYAVPIARHRRQIEPYVIERIENRELHYESDKFIKPIEELPNRDREIRTESSSTKHTSTEVDPRAPELSEEQDRDIETVHPQESNVGDGKYPASEEDFVPNREFTTETNLSSQEVAKDYEKIMQGREEFAMNSQVTSSPVTERSKPIETNANSRNHQFEEMVPETVNARSKLDENDAVRMFLEGLGDKVQEQYAGKRVKPVDDEPVARHRFDDQVQEKDEEETQEPINRESSLKEADIQQNSDKTFRPRAESTSDTDTVSDKRMYPMELPSVSMEKQVPADRIAIIDAKPNPVRSGRVRLIDEHQAIFVNSAKQNPTEETPTDDIKHRPTESTLASEVKEESIEEMPEYEIQEDSPKEEAPKRPTYTPRRRTQNRSHSVLRSSSEELTSLLEDRDSTMEKDLVSQSQSEKSSSIVQRSPNDDDDSEEDKDKSDKSKEKNDDNKEEEELRSEVGDIIMTFYPTEENITYIRNTFSSMLDSVMNFVAISNAVASMNNVQPLLNIISRFSPNN